MNIVKEVTDSYKKNPVKVIGISLFILVGLMFSWYITISLIVVIYLWKKFKQEEEGKKNAKKKCLHCQTEIDWLATRCPHCQGKMSVWTAEKKILATIFILAVLIGITKIGSSPNNSTPAVSVDDTTVKVGDPAVLRLSSTSDPTQIICLGATREDFDKVTKAFLAKDYVGLLEIPGVFCVSNGTKVQVIDSAYGVRKVRIFEGVRKVDEDKVLRSGWTAMEWVTKP